MATVRTTPAKPAAKTRSAATAKRAGAGAPAAARVAAPAAAPTVVPVPERSMKSAPSLRFPISPALWARTLALLDALEAAPGRAGHREALADLAAEYTDVGLDYYYLKALKKAEVGFVVEQSARLSLSGASKLISSVSRKFLVRLNDDQLVVVARHIREMG
jgi:hypothetical protein